MTNWFAVGSSADGTKLLAVHDFVPYGADTNDATWFTTNNPIYVSSDSGVTWTPDTSVAGLWFAVAMSADGNKLVLGGAGMVQSTNFGLTWLQAPVTEAYSVACSGDGNTLVAVPWLGLMSISSDAGTTWFDAGLPMDFYGSVAASADASKLVAVSQIGPIYLSTNSGSTWRTANAPLKTWKSVASSADGTRLVAAVTERTRLDQPGPIYSSADSGATWTKTTAPTNAWWQVASSADGCKVVAVEQALDGGIYTWQTTPHPVLNVVPSGTNVLLSWVIPSQPFVLQQNTDVSASGWVDIDVSPILNLTNLQNQITLPIAESNRFYRLKRVAN